MTRVKEQKINTISRGICILLFAGIWLTVGCGTKTTVVLLPESDGRVGQLTVTSDDNTSEVLNTAFESAHVGQPGESVVNDGILDEKTVEKTFGSALAAQPDPPEIFILYFKSGRTELTEKSRALIPNILASIQQRNSNDVSVVGHTDTVGNADRNTELAKRRAGFLTDMLVKEGVERDLIEVASHGERNPLVPTADEVAEPKNRRVEVVVR